MKIVLMILFFSYNSFAKEDNTNLNNCIGAITAPSGDSKYPGDNGVGNIAYEARMAECKKKQIHIEEIEKEQRILKNKDSGIALSPDNKIEGLNDIKSNTIENKKKLPEKYERKSLD